MVFHIALGLLLAGFALPARAAELIHQIAADQAKQFIHKTVVVTGRVAELLKSDKATTVFELSRSPAGNRWAPMKLATAVLFTKETPSFRRKFQSVLALRLTVFTGTSVSA